MSRFDDELVKEAENAWQQSGAPGPSTGEPYDQQTTINLDTFGAPTMAPTPADEVNDWIADMPMMRQLDVQDLDAAEEGEIVGGPGSSAVYAEGGPMYASVDESLYQVYKASREIRDAIETREDFDFSSLLTASNNASSTVRSASNDQEVVYTVGTIAGIVNDIENDLVMTANYKQAYDDLKSLEGLLETINKVAENKTADALSCGTCGEPGCSGSCGANGDMTMASKKTEVAARIAERELRLAEKDVDCDIEACDGGKGCKKNTRKASNGNQESLMVTDVRDLDDQAGVFDFEKTITPDHVTNVEVPEDVNGEDAGYVPYYNDGAETGKTPQEDDSRDPFPYDGTNPALVPYAGTVAAVQAGREKIFEALQIVERLEKLGMVQEDDRAKHIAKFEQMSDGKLEGIRASLDMFEESGARQPRSQKVASGSNRLPEMGRMTTASTVSRQDILVDDFLMTL